MSCESVVIRQVMVAGAPTSILWNTVAQGVGTYNASDWDYVIADATAGNVTINLPVALATNPRAATRVIRIDNSVNTVTIDAGAGNTIFGTWNGSFYSAQTLMLLQGEMVEAVGEGTVRYIS